MRKHIWIFSLLLAAACQRDEFFEDLTKVPTSDSGKTISIARLTSDLGLNCGESKIISLQPSTSSPIIGRIEWKVGEENIHVDYVALNEWFFRRESAWAGGCEEYSTNPADFPYQQAFAVEDEIRSFSFNYPLDGLPPCGCLILDIELVSWYSKYEDPPSLAFYNFQYLMEYCKCPDNKNLRTQSQGGWGAAPHGDNAAAYLYSNFSSAFPNGLILGCNYKIVLTSAEAVSGFLPQGGKPAALSMNYIDPLRSPQQTNNPKNVLAGQVATLKLSVGFDAWDENFGESFTNLSKASITAGIFEGWTVSQVLTEAEKVLGGCPSNYSASELNKVVSAINESFVDGKNNTGFLMNGM